MRLKRKSKLRDITTAFALSAALTVLLMSSGALQAAAAYRISQTEREQLNPLAKDYVFFEVARNYPQSFSLESFKAGGYHPVLGYRFNLRGSWLMGVGAQFKNFERVAKAGETLVSKNFALWSLYHEGLYILRLDHPTYLLLGPKILYLLAAKAASVPLVRDEGYVVEIGGAFSVSLMRIFDNKSFMSLRIDRWRGTKTMKLHGLEFSVGYGWPLF